MSKSPKYGTLPESIDVYMYVWVYKGGGLATVAWGEGGGWRSSLFTHEVRLLARPCHSQRNTTPTEEITLPRAQQALLLHGSIRQYSDFLVQLRERHNGNDRIFRHTVKKQKTAIAKLQQEVFTR